MHQIVTPRACGLVQALPGVPALGWLVLGLAATGLQAQNAIPTAAPAPQESSAEATAAWSRFRGPHGSGVSKDAALPLEWSDEKGILWKTELPGPGTSSPIVSGNRIFVTAYSGYGVERNTGSLEDLERHVVSLDRPSGRIVWDRAIAARQPEEAYRPPGMTNHGYASHTPVADGERVYAFLGKSGVVAFDFAGNEAWRVEVCDNARTTGFGSASSPLLAGDLVVVPASVECEAIIAYEKRSGKEAWRAQAEGYGAWWTTPVVVGAGDSDELVVSVPEEVWGLNPANGKLRWFAELPSTRTTSTSVVAADGVVYAFNGGSMAVRVGGRGDVGESHVVWRSDVGGSITSPVAYDGRLYVVSDRGGRLQCLDASSGEEVFQGRLEGARAAYASPIVADGKLYVVTRGEGTFVLDAGSELRVLARNTIASDTSDFSASPAVDGSRLLLRSNTFLYAISGADATDE